MKFIAKTLYGLEQVLCNELEAFGASGVTALNRAVIFSGDREMLYRVNYCSRTALSVLMPVSEFRIRSGDDLYKNAKKIEWSDFLDTDQTFSVVPVINSPLFRHTGYPGLVLKDAVADWFMDNKRSRPSVNTNDPSVVLNLHISNDLATISLDSSVIPLFKRGYRKEQGTAPLNEVLAAGIIMLSGWDATTSLTDPMCGSGTIPIEAALMASGTPPGKFRNFFGFQRWKDYDNGAFERLINESGTKTIKPATKISGSDISDEAILMAGKNVESAGLTDLITLERTDFGNLKANEEPGFLIFNPPYGQRIKTTEPDDLYSKIGSTLKHNFPGYTALIITAGKENITRIGLKAAEKRILYNGSLECTLAKYLLYQGSKKAGKIN